MRAWFWRQVVVHFLPLEALLDECVGGSVTVEVERGGRLVSAELAVQDLHAVSPSSFLESAGGVLHGLSYQQARNNSAHVGQVWQRLFSATQQSICFLWQHVRGHIPASFDWVLFGQQCDCCHGHCIGMSRIFVGSWWASQCSSTCPGKHCWGWLNRENPVFSQYFPLEYAMVGSGLLLLCAGVCGRAGVHAVEGVGAKAGHHHAAGRRADAGPGVIRAPAGQPGARRAGAPAVLCLWRAPPPPHRHPPHRPQLVSAPHTCIHTTHIAPHIKFTLNSQRML